MDEGGDDGRRALRAAQPSRFGNQPCSHPFPDVFLGVWAAGSRRIRPGSGRLARWTHNPGSGMDTHWVIQLTMWIPLVSSAGIPMNPGCHAISHKLMVQGVSHLRMASTSPNKCLVASATPWQQDSTI